MATTTVQDFYKSTITRNWGAGLGDFNVSVKPTVVPGIIVVSPNSTTQREIVRYTAVGTNAYGDFITVSNLSDRGLSDTTAQSHLIGEQVRMNITAVHWDELLADAVAPTIEVGTTTTLKSGESATVTNSGDDINAVFDFEIPKGSTIYSTVLIPDNSIGMDGDWAFSTSSTSNVFYKSAGAWALVNSNKGAQGDQGNGITSIVKTNTVGLVDTYTITYEDASTSTFDITNGAQGNTGDAGISIVSVIKTGTVGLVDTYTITYSNTTTSEFTVTNGEDGTNGTNGISFLWQGDYNGATDYEPNDAVSYLGSSYMCKSPSTGNLPTNGTYWDVMAQKGTDGEGAGDTMSPATNTDSYIPQWDGADSKTLKNGIPTSTFEPAKGVDDNYITDAEKVKLANLSGTNTGDQTLPVKATGAELAAGTDDAKFATALGLVPFTNNSLYRQAIINGNFDVWQRGTSFTDPAHNTYTADRTKSYLVVDGGTSPTLTHTRQAQTTGALDKSFYFYRVNTNGAGTSLGVNSNGGISQIIEYGTRFLCGASKTVTVSFWAKSDIANKKIGVWLQQNYGTGGSPTASETINGTKWTLTSTWTKYTHTFTTNTLASKTFGTDNNDLLRVFFEYMYGSTTATRVGDTGAETFVGFGNIDIAQVQLNAGSVALPFQPKSYADELRDCQRYCYVPAISAAYSQIGSGHAATTTVAYININLPVPMRTQPAVTATAGDWVLNDGVNTIDPVTALIITDIGPFDNKIFTMKVSVASGLTAFRPYNLLSDGTANRLLVLSAEL